tara:strand:- start:361 stop:1248 length:888 start_codon:yes stop_codon:yes gene_type:complete
VKILLVGSSGQLGKSIIQKIPQNVQMVMPTKKEFNLKNGIECYKYIISNQPDWVINSGAYTNVDKAEEEQNLAYTINSEGPQFIAKGLREIGGKLLQISTDYVFNGEQNTPYLPNQSLSPINIYGKTKAKAEELLANILVEVNQLSILRTSWLISKRGENFATKIMQLNDEKKELNVICDQIGSPTCSKSLATAIWKLIEVNDQYSDLGKKFPRISQFTDNGIASWYDVAVAVSEIAFKKGLIKKMALIKPIFSSQYTTKALRPSYSVLESALTKKILKLKKLSWRDALIEEFGP